MDFSITKSHPADFVLGQTGTYTITVKNVGNLSSDTPVTVSDTLPAGLSATGIGGTGWSCTQPGGPCTSGGSSPGTSLPDITLTVSVANNAPAVVTNTATVVNRQDTNSANDTANDPTNIVSPFTTPVITSMGSSFASGTSQTIPPAITSGTPVSSFKLYINGQFDPRRFGSVSWFDPVTGVTTTFSGSGVSFTSTQIVISIPANLYSTLVTSPDAVQVSVTEFAQAPIVSNPATYTINPPLTSLGPNLPSATVGTPYSQRYFTGGTATFQIILLSGLPDGLVQSPDGQTIQGTPTKAGSFTFQPGVQDAWGNVVSGNDTILVTGGTGPTITSVVPNSTSAGISSVSITVTGTNYTPTPAAGTSGSPGSVVTWTAPNAAPVALATTFVSATQLTATIPGNLVTLPVTANITVSQSGGSAVTAPATSNSVPFTVNPPSISALSPAGATAGAAAFTLTVSGANFVNNTQPAASSQVIFGGTQLATTFVNTGTLTVPITPAMIAIPGPITVVVANPGGAPSAAVTFTVSGAPTLISINPNFAIAGGAAFLLTATGTNFSRGMSIRFGASAFPGACVGGASGATTGTPCASNQISTTIPASLIATPGTAPVSVATADGAVSGSLPFTIIPKLTITTTALPGGTVGASYAVTLTAAGGVAPLVWAATGLPAGLSVNATTGAITGTPTAFGTSTVSVTVNDSSGQAASAQFQLVISGSLVITTTALPNGTLGSNYSFTLTAAGGVGTLTWSATGLPAGLALNTATGAITGTPTAPGTSTVSVTVTDTSKQTASAQFPLVITGNLVITTTALPNGFIGSSYSFTLAASGGVTPYTWSATGLPAGLSVNAATGTITGTPTTVGVSTVAVTVSDTSKQTASATFRLTILNRLVITTTALPNGTVSVSYTFTLAASGGTSPLTWSATGLPAGLALNSATGVISGTPTTAGTSVVPVTVTDNAGQTASATFGLTIVSKLAITAGPLPSGIVGHAYSAFVTATGGAAPETMTVTGLPAGLSFSQSLPIAQINCVPFPSGLVPFTSVAYVSATNATGDALLVGSLSAATLASLQSIPASTAPNLQFCGTVQLANGFTATTYVPTAAERAGDFSQFGPPLVDPNTGLALPGNIIPLSRFPGLYAMRISQTASPNSVAGTISGIPTAAGTFTPTVTVTDANGQTASAQVPLTIFPQLVITTTALPPILTGTPYNFTLTAAGGLPPLVWSATGLPSGLTLNTATGAITGTPTATSGSTVAVTVKDAGGQTAAAQFPLTVVPRLVITSGNLPGATAGVSFSFRLTAIGGLPPYTWSATGLAPGLTLNPQTGDITGIPTSAGSSTVSVTVTDTSAQTASAQFSFSASQPPIPPLTISTNSLPNGTVGVGYGASIGASGGTPPYAFSQSGGNLPPGLNFLNGSIGGTPTTPGTFSVSVRVTDSNNGTAARDFTILINPAPLAVTGSVSDGVVGSAISASFGATGGVPPYVFGASGAVPTGTTFTSAGSLSGTATATGVFTFSVTATDKTGATASKSFTITVTAPPLVITTSSLPNAAVGTAFSVTFAATGGVPPYTFSGSGGPAGLSFSGSTLSGTPTQSGSFTVTVTVTDSVGTKATKTFTLTVATAVVISTASLPDGVIGAGYSASLGATGGVPPYSFSVSGLPDGLTASSDGTLSGTPTTRGTNNVSVKVTDSNGNSASKSFALTVAPAPLVITTQSLPNGTVGTAYSSSFQATGGVPPYSLKASGTPAGLTFGADGTLSGTPSAAGTSSVVITVTDSTGATAGATVSLTVVLPAPPNVTVAGVPATANSSDQADLKVSLDRSFPVDVTVTLTLTVAPVSGTPPQDVQFASGGQTASFVVPANTAPSPTDVFLQLGTVAGTVTVTEKLTIGAQDITPSPAPTQTIQVAAAAPVLTGNPSVTATRNATGFTVVATGFSNTREIAQALFQFTAASGSTLQTSQLTISGDTLFTPYYQSAASNATGGAFKLTQPFTVQGSTQAIVSVTLTLTNRVGSSKPVTVNLQ